MGGSPEKTPGAPENQPQQKTQAELIKEQHDKLDQTLTEIEFSPKSSEEKLKQLKTLYEDQLVFELKNTKLDTRQEFDALQKKMIGGMKERLKNLEDQMADEPTEDLKRAVEVQKEKIYHLEKTKKFSGSISRKRKRILRRLAVHESPQMKAVREVVKGEILQSINDQVPEDDKESFKNAVRLMTEKIAELDMKDDTNLIQELYAELYSGAMLKKYKEPMDKLREEKENITKEKRKQAFDLFMEVDFQQIARENSASVLTPKERESLSFKPEDMQKPEQIALRKKLMTSFANRTKYLFGKFLTAQKLEHLAPESPDQYLQFCSEHDTAITTTLMHSRMTESKTDRDMKMLKVIKKDVEADREKARGLELSGNKEGARELREQANLAEDFQENFELSLREQTLPPKGVTFDLIAKGLDYMPNFRDMDASSLLVKAPILFMGLSTFAANAFPLGKDIYMQFHNKVFTHLTVNPFKWPKLAYKLAKAGITVPLGIAGDTLKWFGKDYAGFTALILGGGMTALASSSDLREKVTNALTFSAKEIAGYGPIAGLMEQLRDATHGSLKAANKSEYMKVTKGMIYEYMWKWPKEQFDDLSPKVLEFFESWDIRIDEVKAHQQSVIDTEKALEARGFDGAKSLTVSYEKYNSFLLHYLPDDADENYQMPIEVLRDMGYFTDADDLGEMKEVDYSQTVDTYHAMQLYADQGKPPNMKGVLKGDERAWYNPMKYITDPTQTLAQQVFGVSRSDEGLKSVTPEFASKTWNALTESGKHPMRYMSREQVAKSIALQSDRLITEMGTQEVDDEGLTVNAFIDQKLETGLTEEKLKKWVEGSTLRQGMEKTIYESMNERFPLEGKEKKPLDAETLKKNQAERMRYLVKAGMIMQGTRDMMVLHGSNPPQENAKRSTQMIKPGKKLIDLWTKQKEWLQKKTNAGEWFAPSSTIAS